jgi:hypothetical protein
MKEKLNRYVKTQKKKKIQKKKRIKQKLWNKNFLKSNKKFSFHSSRLEHVEDRISGLKD